MTLRHLQILQAVADTENFTRAAERLYITQSAISHAVRELEEEAGTALFDRLSKRIKITESGKQLLEEALPILTAFEVLSANIGSLERRTPLQIVSCITIGAYRLPEILHVFSQKWPDIPVHVEVVSAQNAVRTLREGKADIAFIEGAKPEGPFEGVAFGAYPLLAVCAPGYPAANQTLDLDAFCAETLLLREPGSAIRDVLDSALLLSGRAVDPAWTSVNSPALIEAAKAGLGIAVLPEILVEEALAAQKLAPVFLTELQLSNQMLAVWHRDKRLSAPLRDLLGFLPGVDEKGLY